MIKNEKSLQSGHRARMRQDFRDGNLSDRDLLELLLTYAIPRRDVRALSRRLYNKYGNIRYLLAAPYEDLIQNEGVKESTATFLKLIHKLTELTYKVPLIQNPIFHNYQALQDYCLAIASEKQIEEFHVFYLDTEHKLIKDELHSTGTIDHSEIYIREIVKNALNLNACYVAVLHNHPRIDASFSEADIETTLLLKDALEKVGIGLFDHLLVAGDMFYSARNMFLLK